MAAVPSTNSSRTSMARLTDKKDARRLKNILFDADTSLTITPLQLLFISLGFILTVLLTHILLRIFPKTSPGQVLLAIVVLLVSVAASAALRKK